MHQASECVGAAGAVGAVGAAGAAGAVAGAVGAVAGAAGAVGLSLKGQWVSGPHSEYFILLPLVVVHK